MPWRAWCVLLLVACSGPSAPIPRAPRANPQAPPCPACPPAVTGTAACPICPPLTLPTPVPPQPAAQPWQCIDVLLDRAGNKTSYCWITLEICQKLREKKRKRRRTTACAAQSLAYCLRLIDPVTMGHQLMCTRTRDHCDVVREELLGYDMPDAVTSQCQSMRNHMVPFDTSLDDFYAQGEPD